MGSIDAHSGCQFLVQTDDAPEVSIMCTRIGSPLKALSSSWMVKGALSWRFTPYKGKTRARTLLGIEVEKGLPPPVF